MNTATAENILRNFFNTYHRLPSYGEMRTLFGFKSKKACFDLAKKLIDTDILGKDATGKLTLNNITTPIPFLGSIQAGFPSPAEEQLYMNMSFNEYLVNKPERSFVLRVNGDSMIEAGIKPGDLVIIEKDHTPRNGDIVVAFIDNAWTLKYFQNRKGKVCLVPANPKYPILYPTQELIIWGIVVSVIRKYN